MTHMQFGLVIPGGAGWTPGTTRATFVADTCQALERVSGVFDSAWVADHLDVGPRDIAECWSALSYFAALSPTLRFGPAVACHSYRHPALLAKMAATLHYLTDGRLILGVGAGWLEAEYRAYGYDFPPNGVRVAQLDEALHIMKALWHEMPATFQGRYYTVENAHCEPRHSTAPTVMIGARGPRMMQLTARHADWWTAAWVEPSEYRMLVERLTRACNEVGRDPATVRKTWIGVCACASTEEAARQLLKGGWLDGGPPRGVVGTPPQIVDQLRPYIDAGMDYWIVSVPHWPDLATIDCFIHEVIPLIHATYGNE